MSKKFKVTVPIKFHGVAIVEAETEQEAKEKVADMECSPCIHGSYMVADYTANEELVLEDGTQIDMPSIDAMEIEEYQG